MYTLCITINCRCMLLSHALVAGWHFRSSQVSVSLLDIVNRCLGNSLYTREDMV